MKNEQAIVEIIIKGQQPNATLKEIEASARQVRAQLKGMATDSKEFAAKSEELKKINTRLKAINEDVKATGSTFQKISGELKAFGIIAAAAFAFTWASGKVQSIVQGNAELSDSLADVRKTTGMTEAQVKKLNTALGQMDTRTATKDLRQIAIVAGQLGIAKTDILAFTAATDKMVVSLGDEFTGGAGEVTKVMGGLRNIFSDIKTDKIDQDMLHIGNAINVLASEGAATGPVVSDFANRIGGVGISLGLTSAQVLGLSATLQELNVSTERGGTAVTKILQKMTTHVKEFAAVADMDVKSFATLVNNDLFGAFNKVIEGSKKSGTSATALGAILDSLGVDGAGASEVMTKLSGNMGMLKEKVAVAGTSLKGTDSIMSEFRLKNATLGAEMDRLGKSIAGAFTNSTVSNALKSMIGLLGDIFDNTKKLSASMEDERVQVQALLIELETSNTTQERRKEIYEELVAINPELVAGIDRENISIQTLTRNIAQYNEVQIKKIALQKKQEEIDKSNETAAEKLTSLSEAQSTAYSGLAKIKEMTSLNSFKYRQIVDDETLALSEKTKALYDLARAEEWKTDKAGNNKRDREAQQVRLIIEGIYELTTAEKGYQSAANESAKLTHEKLKMEKDWGMEAKANLDYSKKTEQELKDIITENTESRGMFAKEAAAAAEELKKRVNAASKSTNWIDEEALKKAKEKAKKHAEEVARIYESLMKELNALSRENHLFPLDAYSKEVETVWLKHQEMMDKINVNEKMTKAEKDRARAIVRENTSNELEEIDKKHFDKLDAELKEHLKNQETMLNSAVQNEVNAVVEKFDKEIEYNKKHNLEWIELEKQKQAEIAKINGRGKEQPAGTAGEVGLNWSDQLKSDLGNALEQYQTYYAAVSELAQSFQALRDYEFNREVAVAERKSKSDMEREQRLLDSKITNEATYKNNVIKINHEKDNTLRLARLKQAAAEKNAAKFNTYLHSAEAVAQIWAKHAANPVVAGVLTGVTLGTMAMQLALINKQPIPQYAAGGMHAPNGYVSSPTLFSSSSGSPFIAGEAGAEWIAPNWMLQNPVSANAIGMLEAMRAGRTFAGGGSSADTSSSKSNSQGNTAPANFGELITVINRLNQHLDKGLGVNYDLFTKDMASIDSARKGSAV